MLQNEHSFTNLQQYELFPHNSQRIWTSTGNQRPDNSPENHVPLSKTYLNPGITLDLDKTARSFSAACPELKHSSQCTRPAILPVTLSAIYDFNPGWRTEKQESWIAT